MGLGLGDAYASKKASGSWYFATPTPNPQPPIPSLRTIPFEAIADIIINADLQLKKEQLKRSMSLERVLIKRQGSYLYAKSFAIIVMLLTFVYGGLGAVLAIITESDLEDVLDEIIFPILAFVPVLMMWLGYVGMLLAFKRESSHTIEVSEEGIRETRAGREHRFIPWAGVREIELVADLFGGLSLKAKGAFSEIAISNVDLAVTRPMSITKMHRALSKANEMRKLFERLRSAAPQAALRSNRLAKRRLTQYAFDGRSS